MLPYGLPRIKDVECPDLADLLTYGMKSSRGRLDGKSNHHSSEKKRRNRRIWKRKARLASKQMCVLKKISEY